MNKNKEELKSCPFCDSENIQTVILGGLFETSCWKCGSRGGLWKTENRSIEAWNMRPEHENKCRKCEEWERSREI